MALRTLDAWQIREIALAYLCGVDVEPLEEKFGVSDGTIRQNVLPKYSRELNDPLVEFYRETPHNKRIRNAAHLYLAYNDKPVPNTNLVSWEDRGTYQLVREEIYVPRIDALAKEICLDAYLKPENGVEKLLANIAPRNSHKIIESFLLDTLYEAYQSGELSKWEPVYEKVKASLINIIKSGCFAMTSYKKRMVHDVLQTLTPREEKVLRWRFGAFEKVAMSLEEIGEEFDVGRERIRQIEAKALIKLRHPSRRKKIELAYSLRTDAELESIETVQKAQEDEITWRKRLYSSIEKEVMDKLATDDSLYQRVRSIREEHSFTTQCEGWTYKPVEELELSVRSSNCLKNACIQTIGDLCNKTAVDLLKCRNFGRKSLKEIKEVLAEMDLCLKGSEIWYPLLPTKDGYRRIKDNNESFTPSTPEEERTWREKLYSSIEEEVLGKVAADGYLYPKIQKIWEQSSSPTLSGELASKKSIAELELSVRSNNCLRYNNIQTVGDLCNKTEADLLKLKNLGHRSLKEIKEVLAEMGLSLKKNE